MGMSRQGKRYISDDVIDRIYKVHPGKREKQKTLDYRSLQCRRILGGRNLDGVRDIVVAAIFDFMTVEDWEE